MKKQKKIYKRLGASKSQILYQITSLVCIILGALLMMPMDIMFIPPELPKAIPGALLVGFGVFSILKLRWARTAMFVLTAVMLPFALFSAFWVLLILYMGVKGALPGGPFTQSFFTLTLATIGFIGSFVIFARQAYIDYRHK